jgi:hypothetical protein
VSTIEIKLMKGYKLLRILEETYGSKKKPARCLVEYKRGRAKPVVQWYVRSYANGLFGTDQMEAMRVKVAEEVQVEGTSL